MCLPFFLSTRTIQEKKRKKGCTVEREKKEEEKQHRRAALLHGECGVRRADTYKRAE